VLWPHAVAAAAAVFFAAVIRAAVARHCHQPLARCSRLAVLWPSLLLHTNCHLSLCVICPRNMLQAGRVPATEPAVYTLCTCCRPGGLLQQCLLSAYTLCTCCRPGGLLQQCPLPSPSHYWLQAGEYLQQGLLSVRLQLGC
jgi:hypothetical protein